MYTVTMDEVKVMVSDGTTWVMEIDLCEATSLGQRITNGKILSISLPRLHARMTGQGMTRVEQDVVEDKIFAIIHAHPNVLV